MEKAKTEKRIVRAEDGNKNRKQMGDSREDKFVGWKGKGKHESTVGQVNQKPRRKYWATRSSIHSFARTAHSFACFRLLASLAPSAALARSLRSIRSLPRLWEREFLMSWFCPIVGCTAGKHWGKRGRMEGVFSQRRKQKRRREIGVGRGLGEKKKREI